MRQQVQVPKLEVIGISIKFVAHQREREREIESNVEKYGITTQQGGKQTCSGYAEGL